MPSAGAHTAWKLPNGSVRLVEPDFAGRLNGFTLLFEAFILLLSGQMPFAAVSRVVGESPHRVLAVCEKYVEKACGLADHSNVTALAIDETSRARGYSYVTLAAHADARRVLFVTQGRDAKTIKDLTSYLEDHGCPAGNITQTSIDMSPAFISGGSKHFPNARITFDKFHIIGHASAAVDKMRRIEHRVFVGSSMNSSNLSPTHTGWSPNFGTRPFSSPRIPPHPHLVSFGSTLTERVKLSSYTV